MADQDIDELREDAARQRAAIARDLEHVGDRVSPGRIVERRRAAVVGRFQGVRTSVFGSPDPKGMRTVDRSTYGVSGDGVGTTPSTDGGGERGGAAQAMDKVKDAAPDSAADFTEGNPIAAGLIGVGLGLLVATLIPETREEQRLADEAQEQIDALAGDLAQSGREAAEAVKPAAQEAVENVKSSAQDSARTVQSEGKAAADDVKSKAEEKRDEVQSDG